MSKFVVSAVLVAQSLQDALRLDNRSFTISPQDHQELFLNQQSNDISLGDYEQYFRFHHQSGNEYELEIVNNPGHYLTFDGSQVKAAEDTYYKAKPNWRVTQNKDNTYSIQSAYGCSWWGNSAQCDHYVKHENNDIVLKKNSSGAIKFQLRTDLQHELEDQQVVAKLTSSNENKTKEIASLQAESNSQKSQINELSQQNADLVDEVQQQKDQIQEQNDEIERLEKDVLSNKKFLKFKEIDIQNWQARYQKVNQQLATIARQNKQAQTSNEVVVTGLKSEIVEKTAVLEELQKDAEANKVQIAELTQAKEELQNNLEVAVAKTEELTRINKETTTKLVQVQEKHEKVSKELAQEQENDRVANFTWNSTRIYMKNEYVLHKGYIYRARGDNLQNKEPTASKYSFFRRICEAVNAKTLRCKK